MPISSFCSAAASAAAISRRPVESACCRPEDDPFLLLESTLRAVKEILVRRPALPLRRTWIDHAFGEEEITRLEEELLPAMRECLSRIDEIDQQLLAEQQMMARFLLEADREALLDQGLQFAEPSC